MPDKELTIIEDFIDFNYCSIAFDVTDVSRDDLLEKLKQDCVNHLWELDDSKYIAIENCDLQGFADLFDICFDSFKTTYILAKLVYKDSKWFYSIVDDAVPILED